MAIDKKGQLKVDYSETIDHTGCFIIEISKTGDDKNFQVLKTISDPANAGVSAANPKTRTETIQLDGGIECQNCTLRLRQIMSGTTTGCGPNTQASTYFSCSDIMIGADASLPDAGMQEEEDSGTTTPDAGSGSNNKDAGTSDGDDDDDDDGSGSPKKDTGGCSTVPGDLPYGGAIGVGLMAAFALIARSRKRRS